MQLRSTEPRVGGSNPSGRAGNTPRKSRGGSHRTVPGFPVYIQPGDSPATILRKAADARRTYLAAEARARDAAVRVIRGELSFTEASRLVRGAA